jgi:hypothetical protein
MFTRTHHHSPDFVNVTELALAERIHHLLGPAGFLLLSPDLHAAAVEEPVRACGKSARKCVELLVTFAVLITVGTDRGEFSFSIPEPDGGSRDVAVGYERRDGDFLMWLVR